MINERMFKRDLHYSQMVRKHGSNCSDVDFTYYNNRSNELRLVEETKFGLVEEINTSSVQFERLRNLADRCGVPFIGTIYFPLDCNKVLCDAVNDELCVKAVHIQYYCFPANNLARKCMTEKWYSDRELADLKNSICGNEHIDTSALSDTIIPVNCIRNQKKQFLHVNPTIIYPS